MSRWEFFDPKSDVKLTCSCGCGRMDLDDEFMGIMVECRRAIGLPFIVTSGFRCPEHNSRVSKTGPTGPHTWGRALDVAASGGLRFAILDEAKKRGCTRFGIAKWGLHVDNLGRHQGFAENVIWTY